MATNKTNIKEVFENIRKRFDKVVQKSLEPLGREAIRLIVVRTRLGYSVSRQGASRGRLKKLSPNYVKFRERFSRLSSLTTAKRSNLTLTGQMLDSMEIIKISNRNVVIGPRGRRSDGTKNEDLARWVQKAGRPFLNISRTEQVQLIRFYRRTFGDLARSERLTF